MMTRLLTSFFLVTVLLGLMITGCGEPQNTVVDTESDLWAQREAFYADPANSVEQPSSEDESN